MKQSTFLKVLSLAAVIVMAFAGSSMAMMGTPGVPGSGTTGSGGYTAGGMMGPGGYMGLTNTGGFGMTNGMAGAPVVGSDGTAYLVSYNPSANPGQVPTSSSFESTITAISPSGAVNSITLQGIVSRPVVYGDVLVATSSLPDMGNFDVFTNYGGSDSAGQSMAYVVTLPLAPNTTPVGVSLDGEFASTPVIANNNVYVVTSDFGNGMMVGNGTFSSMYGNYNFNTSGNAHSYLYIIGFDGSLVNKITLQ